MMQLQELMRMTLRGGMLIVLACLLRALLGRHLPKWTVVLLWCAAILRLLAPFAVPVRVPVEWLADGSGGRWYTISTAVQQAGAGSAATLWWCWLLGAAALAALLAVMCLHSHRKLREALPRQDAYCMEFVMRQHLRRRVQVLVSDQVATPITCGVLRPRIILPKTMDLTQRGQLLCVLTHEAVHIRRMDVLIKLAALAALCIHWFNPLVWLLVFLLDRDLEKACDEKVIALLGEERKHVYATALVDLAEQKNRFSPLYSGFGQNGLEERILSIMKYQKISRLTATAAALAVLAAAGASAAELKPVKEIVPTAAFSSTTVLKASDAVTADKGHTHDEITAYAAYEKVGVTVEADGTLHYKGQQVGSLQDLTAGLFYFDNAGTVHLEAVYDGEELTGVRECEAPKTGTVEFGEIDGNTITFDVADPGDTDGLGTVYTITPRDKQ